MNYTIKHSFWDAKTELLRDGHVIGSIESSGFLGYTTTGYLHDKVFTFANRGVFSSRTEIFDHCNNLIGDIEYAKWSSKRRIGFKWIKLLLKTSYFLGN